VYDKKITDGADQSNLCPSGAENTRIVEQPYLDYRRAGATRVDARRPLEVPMAVLDAAAQLDTPDDVLTRWPVYLGRIVWDPAATDERQRFAIDLTDRVYVDLMAEIIDHPEVPARVELGRVDVRDERRTLEEVDEPVDYVFEGESAAERRRFAVFVPPPTEVPLKGEVRLSPRLAIYEKLTRLRGNTVVEGDLELVGTQLTFDGPINPSQAANVGDYPSLYRVSNDTDVDELRIDLGTTASSKRAFVIGLTNEDGSFRPCIRMELRQDSTSGDDQPLVTIFGDLELKGLFSSKDTKFPVLSEEVMAALRGAFQSGVAAAGGV
jgi:hypothetical protein